MVIVHDVLYPLGLFAAPLRSGSGRVVSVLARAREHRALDASDFDGILCLGGDMDATHDERSSFLRGELELIADAHIRGVPVLGVCLGGQVVARALGGRVWPWVGREVGWHEVEFLADDPLLGPAGSRRRFLWHRDCFEPPPDAVLLARTEGCSQAFRIGTSYGLQFHPEIDPPRARFLAGSTSAELLEVTAAERARISDPPRDVSDERSRVEAARLIRGFLAAASAQAASVR